MLQGPPKAIGELGHHLPAAANAVRSNTKRLLHFVENPAFAAKNRYTCPDDIEMTIENIEKLIPISK